LDCYIPSIGIIYRSKFHPGCKLEKKISGAEISTLKKTITLKIYVSKCIVSITNQKKKKDESVQMKNEGELATVEYNFELFRSSNERMRLLSYPKKEIESTVTIQFSE